MKRLLFIGLLALAFLRPAAAAVDTLDLTQADPSDVRPPNGGPVGSPVRVPEPASLVLVATGVGVLFSLRSRKR